MLDPVKNAKAIGVLTLAGVPFVIPSLFLVLALGQIVPIMIYILRIALGTTSGVGLLLGKRWGVYLFGLSMLDSIGFMVYDLIQGSKPDFFIIILDTVFVGAFIWFFANRGKFR
jgi:hypothetical protein